MASNQSERPNQERAQGERRDSLENVDSSWSLSEYLAKKITPTAKMNRWMRPSKKEQRKMALEKRMQQADNKKRRKQRKIKEEEQKAREDRIAQGKIPTMIDYDDPTRKNPYTIKDVKAYVKVLDNFAHKKIQEQKMLELRRAFAEEKAAARPRGSSSSSSDGEGGESDDSDEYKEPTPAHIALPNADKLKAEQKQLKEEIKKRDDYGILNTYPPVPHKDPDLDYIHEELDSLDVLKGRERRLTPSRLHNYLAAIFCKKSILPNMWNDYVFGALIFAQQVLALHMMLIGFFALKFDHNIRSVADPAVDLDDLPLQRVLWVGSGTLIIGTLITYISFYAMVALFQWVIGSPLIKLYVYGGLVLLIFLYLFAFFWSPTNSICIDPTRRDDWIGRWVQNFYTNDGFTTLRRGPAQTMITMQETLGCCGNKGYTDYNAIAADATDPSFPIPPSCCNNLWYPNIFCGHVNSGDPILPYRIHQTGCSQKLQEYCDRLTYWFRELIPIYTFWFTGLYLLTLCFFAIHFYTLRNEAVLANDLELKLRNLNIHEIDLATGSIYDQLDRLHNDQNKKTLRERAIEKEELIVDEDVVHFSPSLLEFLENMQDELALVTFTDVHRVLRTEIKRYRSQEAVQPVTHSTDYVFEETKRQFRADRSVQSVPKYLIPYAARVLNQKDEHDDFGDLKQKNLRLRLDRMNEREKENAPKKPQEWEWEQPTLKKPKGPKFVEKLQKGLKIEKRTTKAERQKQATLKALAEVEKQQHIRVKGVLEQEKQRQLQSVESSLSGTGVKRMATTSQPEIAQSRRSTIEFRRASSEPRNVRVASGLQADIEIAEANAAENEKLRGRTQSQGPGKPPPKPKKSK